MVSFSSLLLLGERAVGSTPQSTKLVKLGLEPSERWDLSVSLGTLVLPCWIFPLPSSEGKLCCS